MSEPTRRELRERSADSSPQTQETRKTTKRTSAPRDPLAQTIRIACYVFLVFIVVLNFASPLMRLVGAPYEVISIVGGSMEPTIPRNSLILVKTGDFDLKGGDIVSFTPPGEATLTTHRVIEVLDDDSVVTKGDANQAEDALPSARSDVKALYVGDFGPLGSALYSLVTFFGRMVAFAAVLGGFAYARKRQQVANRDHLSSRSGV